MNKQRKAESLAILGCASVPKRDSCVGCPFSPDKCGAMRMAIKAIDAGWGIEKDAISSFMGEVIAMQEPDKEKALRKRFKQLYGNNN